MIADSNLVAFIKEAKKRKFSDEVIRASLVQKGWSLEEINAGFNEIKGEFKVGVGIYLEKRVLDMVAKRAKKNLLTVEEQIEDIVRRSCLNVSNVKVSDDRVDDRLVSIFSRSKKGRKSKKKSKKKRR